MLAIICNLSLQILNKWINSYQFVTKLISRISRSLFSHSAEYLRAEANHDGNETKTAPNKKVY